ncbi:MAG TPA: acetyl-CoA carboxylase biotin carboxylase subunit [Syntrophorhabdus sp.]|jgi:pyruvate carboxylase subunit A|nr:acetyl-CoA carboxylase biotin carboxylase subunit [Syntrophorhabdus sp.]MDI9559379.1 acetyl-CoA carboxylase biotin carboxylase subunit [Pseudomonadota bacterium]OQB73733.1 MAG: Biotin carboxylase [Deltaproteobacteria bacterium ADurb.Bin135]MBP8746036.1 acetyl-CoA carboxylase biotin carboxylase subunit [Syntrophorhabdus sp.]HNQ46629.1 acetyl-CoA carboxylase biotin carboxylase subunit [Syntrophorhabdus sp.]
MFKKILVANRGEIAIRIMRACKEMGIPSVAVYSEADTNALFTKYADEAYLIGPAPATQSYLNMEKVIQTAKACGADAIHPGYGFLAENPGFASLCEQNGIKFIGPSSRVLTLLGDKVAARKEMIRAGVPVVPGTDECVTAFSQAKSIAREIGYPIIIKPSGGGGGIGMTIVDRETDLDKALESTQAIATTTFGICDVYIEKYLTDPRHIEFQLLGDSHGNAIHLGERECSIQRRHQKLIEESPSPAVTQKMRSKMGAIAANAARLVGYEGAGTMEFLFSKGKFYFLEVNARVQVEHPVTEMVTGVDIVKEGIRIASGLPLSLTQKDIRITGSAIECRINAEDPVNDFVPTPGKILRYHEPGGTGIRVDSGVYSSYTIPPFYDPIISKLIVWGRDRKETIARMQRALYEYIIIGPRNNIPFHQAVMKNPRFISGDLGTHFIEKETTLLGDMMAILDQDISLEAKLPHGGDDKKKVAAIAVVAALAQSYGQR